MRISIFAILFFTPLMAVAAVAQTVVPDLPEFLLPFASGHWWVIPAYGLFATVLAYVDAVFLKEDGVKAKWHPLARLAWDIVTANILKSRNEQPTIDDANE